MRGAPTTRYRATLDHELVTRRHLQQEGWKDANIERYLETNGPSEEKVEVWVDDDGLTRRIVTSTSIEVPEVAASHRSVTTTEYFDFGVAPAIEPPPAAEVVESKEWQRLQEQQGRERPENGDEGATTPLPSAFDPAVQPSCR